MARGRKPRVFTNPRTGESKTGNQWAEALGIKYQSFMHRVYNWVKDDGPDWERITTQSANQWRNGAAKRSQSKVAAFQTTLTTGYVLLGKIKELVNDESKFINDIIRESIDSFDHDTLERFSLINLHGSVSVGVKLTGAQADKIATLRLTKYLGGRPLSFSQCLNIVVNEYFQNKTATTAQKLARAIKRRK